MPGIYPPSLATVKQMRDIIKHAKAFRIYIDDDFHIDSMTNFLIWDDDLEVVYCIDSNTAYSTQYIAPFRIRQVGYNQFEEFIYEL